MITQETAGKIWQCHREIAAAEELLKNEKLFPKGDDAADWKSLPIGRWTRESFELSVPKGEGCRELFGIRPTLAKSVVTAHLAAMHALLAELNEMARLEIEGGQS